MHTHTHTLSHSVPLFYRSGLNYDFFKRLFKKNIQKLQMNFSNERVHFPLTVLNML